MDAVNAAIRSLGPAVACLLLMVPLAACGCLSPQVMRDADTKVAASNLARADALMQKAAELRGAVLLPVRARWYCLKADPNGPRRLVPSHPDGAICFTVLDGDDDRPRVRTDQGQEGIVVPVSEAAYRFARVARRGDVLFLLLPKITPHALPQRRACACDGGPIVDFSPRFGIFFPNVKEVRVEEVTVDVPEDFIPRTCDLIAV